MFDIFGWFCCTVAAHKKKTYTHTHSVSTTASKVFRHFVLFCFFFFLFLYVFMFARDSIRIFYVSAQTSGLFLLLRHLLMFIIYIFSVFRSLFYFFIFLLLLFEFRLLFLFAWKMPSCWPDFLVQFSFFFPVFFVYIEYSVVPLLCALFMRMAESH